MAITSKDLIKIPLEQRHIIFKYLLCSHNGLDLLNAKDTTIENFLVIASKPVARPVYRVPNHLSADHHQLEYQDCYSLIERMDYAAQYQLQKQHYVKEDLAFHTACEFICKWYLEFILGGGTRIEKLKVFEALDQKQYWDPSGLTHLQAKYGKEFRDLITTPQLIGLPAEGKKQFLLNGFKDTAIRAIRKGLVDLLLAGLHDIKNLALNPEWNTAGVKYIFFKRKTPAGISEIRNMPIPKINNRADVDRLFEIYIRARNKLWAKVRQHSIFRTKETQKFYEVCCEKLDVTYPGKR